MSTLERRGSSSRPTLGEVCVLAEIFHKRIRGVELERGAIWGSCDRDKSFGGEKTCGLLLLVLLVLLVAPTFPSPQSRSGRFCDPNWIIKVTDGTVYDVWKSRTTLIHGLRTPTLLLFKSQSGNKRARLDFTQSNFIIGQSQAAFFYPPVNVCKAFKGLR